MSGTSGMRGSDDWIERVRAASDIVEVVSQTVALKRVGRNWMGLCPFHSEKTPSFSVHAERQFYHCFSCKAGGDVFRFVQETEKLGFLEAAELLSRRAGIPVPERRPGEHGVRGPLLESMEAAAEAYEQWLADPSAGAAARAYLAGRGVERDAAKEFRLGLAPSGWENLVRRLRPRFGEEVLIQAGLAARREGGRGLYDRFRGRLMVPLVGPGGSVLGFGARALEPGDEPKYLNSPETAVYHKGAFLYGLAQARRHVEADGEMIVVEGYFDAIALHQAGLRNVAATSGTALTPEQARLLRRAVRRVALTYDGDAAGQEAMMRSLGVLLGAGLEVDVVELPGGEDPDSLVRAGGAEAWRAARTRALDPVAFIQRHGLRQGGGGDARERALQAVVELATAVEDPIRLGLLIQRADAVFGIGEKVLQRAVALKRAGARTGAPIRAAVVEQASGERRLEHELLRALLLAPAALESARAQVSPEDFRDPDAVALAGRLWSGNADDPDDSAARLERELTATAEEGIDWEQAAAVRVRFMARRRLERQRRDVQLRIQDLQRQGLAESPETVRLMQQSQDLAMNIQELARSTRETNR